MQKNCEACSAAFETRRGYQRYCSTKCSGHHRQAAYRARQPKAVTRQPCRWCQKEFEYSGYRRLYCSAPCARFGDLLKEVFGKYGITKDEYRDLWFAQDGKCAVCQQPERTVRNTLLCVDHDHMTGAVRGLLCSHCNRAIGLLGDDPAVLSRAIAYLKSAALTAVA